MGGKGRGKVGEEGRGKVGEEGRGKVGAHRRHGKVRPGCRRDPLGNVSCWSCPSDKKSLHYTTYWHIKLISVVYGHISFIIIMHLYILCR